MMNRSSKTTLIIRTNVILYVVKFTSKDKNERSTNANASDRDAQLNECATEFLSRIDELKSLAHEQ